MDRTLNDTLALAKKLFGDHIRIERYRHNGVTQWYAEDPSSRIYAGPHETRQDLDLDLQLAAVHRTQNGDTTNYFPDGKDRF